MTSPAFRNVVISASAGTGKTYQLTNRYLKLLLEGVPPQRILASTFTRKAAGEILDRVLLRLARAATHDDERSQLATALKEPQLSRPQCLDLLSDTLRQLHRMRIGTLDSFFSQIAGSFALELGLPLGWRIAEKLEDDALREQAVGAVLSRGKTQDLLVLFHMLTKGEVNRSVRSLLLVAAREMYELFRESDAAAWKQLTLPGGLSGQELAQAIDELRQAPIPAGEQWRKSHDGDVKAAEAGNWKEFVGRGLPGKIVAGEETYYRKPIPAKVVAAYQALLAHAKSALVGLIARQNEATYELLAKFATEYEQLKDQRRALRFDDITWRLARGLDSSNLGSLAFRLDSGLSHLLLDEFQDTSLAQWQVLRPLAEQVTAAAPKGVRDSRSFFCVGDAKQAIYGWRGGLAEIFDALDSSLDGLEKFSLAKSFRSSQPVIETVNRIFTGLTKHSNLERLEEPVLAWQQAFPVHTTDKVSLPGYVTLQVSPPPSAVQDPDDTHDGFAAAEVARLSAQSPGRSIGVLVRTNDAVARMIYLLRKVNVAASEEGGNPLIDSPAVELLLSLLRIADHPGDTVARFHVARSPLGEAIDYINHRSDDAASGLSHSLRRRLLDEGYGATVLHYAGLLAPICDQRDRSRLTQLVELAFAYQPEATLRVDEFIARIESERVADPSSAPVRVMTIHQAKGLEFDIVVLPQLNVRLTGQPKPFVAGRPRPAAGVDIVCRYCDDSVRQLLPPKFKSLFDEATRQSVGESLCLLYVALTRAIHALHMIVPPNEQERSLPKTYAGLLRGALTDGVPPAGGESLYTCGDPAWHQHDPVAAISAPEVAAEPPTAIRLAKQEGARRRGLGRTSPSSLEGGRTIGLRSLLKPAESGGFAFGTLIHAWLEQIEWLEDGIPGDRQLREVARRLAAEIGELARNLDGPLAAFGKMLEAADLRAVLNRSFYFSASAIGLVGRAAQDWPGSGVALEVLREHRFVIRVGDELLSGSIDRLVLVRSGARLLAADVIDFKTDAIAAGEDQGLSAKVAYYRPQLAAYCRAVAQIFHLPPERITSRLVFVSAGTVVPVDLDL